MITKEIMESTYTEALLRAASILEDSRRILPVHQIMISGIQFRNHSYTIHPKYKIISQDPPFPFPESTTAPLPEYQDYLILFPVDLSHYS